MFWEALQSDSGSTFYRQSVPSPVFTVIEWAGEQPGFAEA